MAHQVAWNRVIVDEFIKEAMLSDEEATIIRARAKGPTRVSQALELNMSVSNIDKITKRLKQKYDKVASYDVLLPPRTSSSDATWKN